MAAVNRRGQSGITDISKQGNVDIRHPDAHYFLPVGFRSLQSQLLKHLLQDFVGQ